MRNYYKAEQLTALQEALCSVWTLHYKEVRTRRWI